MQSGIQALLLGFFWKLVVADNAAPIADASFATNEPTALVAWTGVYAFTLQIYGDFAGYSSIARGLAYLLGFELIHNFRQPYLATNPSDFWERWHISLSSWLRDYLYVPLGGNRSGRYKTLRNLLLTMALGGLWHGAAWNFLIWGLYHGLLLVAFRLAEASKARGKSTTIFKPLKIIGYLHLTVFGWLIFRSESVEQILTFSYALLDLSQLELSIPLTTVAALAFAVLGIDLWLEYSHRINSKPSPFRTAIARQSAIGLYSLLIGAIFLLGSRGGGEFIYFQF